MTELIDINIMDGYTTILRRISYTTIVAFYFFCSFVSGQEIECDPFIYTLTNDPDDITVLKIFDPASSRQKSVTKFNFDISERRRARIYNGSYYLPARRNTNSQAYLYKINKSSGHLIDSCLIDNVRYDLVLDYEKNLLYAFRGRRLFRINPETCALDTVWKSPFGTSSRSGTTEIITKNQFCYIEYHNGPVYRCIDLGSGQISSDVYFPRNRIFHITKDPNSDNVYGIVRINNSLFSLATLNPVDGKIMRVSQIEFELTNTQLGSNVILDGIFYLADGSPTSYKGINLKTGEVIRNHIISNDGRFQFSSVSCSFRQVEPELIPTLSEWGEAILMIIVLIIGVLQFREKKIRGIVTVT